VTLLCFAVFFIPFVGGILPSSWRFFIRAVQTKEVGMSAWAPVQWPTKFALFFGMLMLLVQGVSEILKQILWFFEGKNENQKAVA
jgi:TRAP-type mannitol/chloroaromatic compound transport system permease small subunit